MQSGNKRQLRCGAIPPRRPRSPRLRSGVRFLFRAMEAHLLSLVGWEQLVWIGHDSYLAFADGSNDRSRCRAAIHDLRLDGRVIDGTHEAHPFIACFTEADDDVPVEVQRDMDGNVVAARLCWTYDVDDLDGSEGEWRDVGRLRIRSGSCLALDPVHHVDAGGHLFEMSRGTYRAQGFYTRGDCLGLRLVR